MNIGLIAHDTKKELMVQFCIAYCGVLSRHNVCATGTTGKLVAEATGLDILRFLSGSQGGDQQIAARIACNELDLLLMFRDPITAKRGKYFASVRCTQCSGCNQYCNGGSFDPCFRARRFGLEKYRSSHSIALILF